MGILEHVCIAGNKEYPFVGATSCTVLPNNAPVIPINALVLPINAHVLPINAPVFLFKLSVVQLSIA